MSKSLESWLTDFENRHQREIQLGLSRIRKVAKSLNLLHPAATVISVAGTNGKGSAVTSLEAVYVAAGYQVASYTSPHLLHFNERIKINQKPVSDSDLLQAFEHIDQARGTVDLTYFEIVTLAALWYFAQQRLDVIILETGMGGRLDATNIIDNDLAIITTIDFDHQSWLGNTLEAIGYEKAGILRPGKPSIYADDNPPSTILEKAEECQSRLFRKNRNYHYRVSENRMEFFYKDQNISLAKPSLHPDSVAAAIMAVCCLQEKLPVKSSDLIHSLENMSLPGRQQVFVTDEVTSIFDVSHNPQSVRYLAKFIKSGSYKTVHAVFAALADKDISTMFALMQPLVDHWYPAKLTGKRALSPEKLLAIVNKDEIRAKLCHNDPLAAYRDACNKAEPGDLIVVYGSFFTVAAVLRSQNENGDG